MKQFFKNQYLQRALTVSVGIAAFPLPEKMFTAAAMHSAGGHWLPLPVHCNALAVS